MSVNSREEATAIINKILTKNGGIRPEIKAKTPAESLAALESVRQQLAEATQTLTENLYSTSTRFVLELIQNADDNEYKTIRANGQEPNIEFTVYRDRIVVDCNEDGFSPANVSAICSTGGSTKKGSEGHIGEKGIGFKSVFKVANRVHIQSGYFSFVFKHQKGDEGLGMITPHEEDHKDLPEGVTTRMVLYLSETSKLAQIIQEFIEIPSTLLLFLRKIKNFTVRIDTGDDHRDIKHRYQYNKTYCRATLTRTLVHNGITTSEETSYMIERKMLKELPKDEARKNTNRAEVVLAFPIGKAGTPVIENQYSFAFLPLRKHGFKFIIQSDFITQANREDVFDSSWNKALLNGVAKTFTAAVLNFNKYEALKHSWPKYVPDDGIADSFWSRLQPRILSALKKAAIFLSWSGKSLHMASELRRVPPIFQDDRGQPLLEDLSPELYVSPNYRKEVPLSVLRRLGIETIQWREVKKRLEADIASQNSKLKDSSTEDDWHTKLAEMLLILTGNYFTLQEMKTITLIPLDNGKWISSEDTKTKIYFPTSTINGVKIPIPNDIQLRILQQNAAANASRAKLFEELGVEHCPSDEVVNRIIAAETKSATHLRYLYYFLSKPEEIISGNEDLINLVDTKNRSFPAAKGYLQSSGDYSAEQLFGSDYDAHFLHSSYLAAVPEDVRHNGRTFREWLVYYFDLIDFPQLISTAKGEKGGISADFQFILKHRAGDLLGTLKTHWNNYQYSFNTPIPEKISETAVPCENGSLVPLNRAYLPTQTLREKASEYGVYDQVNFLKLPFTNSQVSLTTQWELLNCLGVRKDIDLNFYIELLAHIANSPQKSHAISTTLVAKLYGAIAKTCEYEFQIQKTHSTRAIRITANRWVRSIECLWSTPYELDTKVSLSSVEEYHGVLQRHLFRQILNCSDLTWEQSVDYLEELKGRFPNAMDDQNHQVLLRAYRHVEEEISKMLGYNLDDFERAKADLRDRFESKELVYIPSIKEWKAPSSCLWIPRSHIVGKTAVSGHYGDLASLFQLYLNIQHPDISMLVDELRNLSATAQNLATVNPTSRAKELIHELNEMKPDAYALRELRTCDFLPVRSNTGGELLCAPVNSTGFVVIDKPQHETAFKMKVRSLSFTLAEIRQLRPFIAAIDLENRYTSSLVTEASKVEGGMMDVGLTNDMRNRAYAMLRCAVHFQAPKIQQGCRSFYQIIKNSIVLRSDNISKTITLKQEIGQSITVQAQKCNLHLEERDGALNFFVSKDENAKEQCYMQQIPQKLVKYIGIGANAEPLLIRIVTARSTAVLEASLTEDGIGHVEEIPLEDRKSSVYTDSLTGSLSQRSRTHPAPSNLIDLTADSQEQASDINAHLQPPSIDSESMEVDTPSIRVSRQRGSAKGQQDELVPRTTNLRSSRASQRDLSASTYKTPPRVPYKRRRSQSTILINSDSEVESLIEPPPSYHDTYIQFLERIIYVAQAATLPVPGTDANSTWIQHVMEPGIECFNDSSFALELACGDRTRDRTAHDRKLGAAGELYVYEFILKLGLPGFSIDNWQSKIRTEVCVHEAYRDLQEWIGHHETADFTYTDTTGTLTNLLLLAGYLSGAYWENAKPLYCIEVKTTLKGPDEPFYVTKGQYKRIRDSKINYSRTGPITKVYIIFRVFNAGKPDTGIRIFVDPAALEDENKLQFTAESYLVHPVGGVDAPRRLPRSPRRRRRT